MLLLQFIAGGLRLGKSLRLTIGLTHTVHRLNANTGVKTEGDSQLKLWVERIVAGELPVCGHLKQQLDDAADGEQQHV
jgi:ketopantoate hydroxymethyltransferase